MVDQPEEAGAFERLCLAFDALPGVGPNAARRMARHVLKGDVGSELADAIIQARATLRRCDVCQGYYSTDQCNDCVVSPDRQAVAELLIVEQPDQVRFWRRQGYVGAVFVLHGWLSPVAGVGPAQLGLDRLSEQIAALQPHRMRLLTDNSVEARATAYFINDMLLAIATLDSELDVEIVTADEVKLQLNAAPTA